jgi:LuxR family transcriptional regulator, quorum-sensing system regulator BjaR1
MASFRTDFYAVLDALKAFDNCQDVSSLQTQMLRSIARYGFQHALVMAAASPENTKSSAERTLLCTWPQTWFDQYHAENFVRNDPIVQTARKSLRGFRWSEAATTTKQAKFIMAAAKKDHGLNHGICVPVRDLDGFRAAVSFAGEEVENSEDARFFTEMIAIYAFHRMSKFTDACTKRILTPRQREIMLWIAAGKNSWDIGVILNISEHTVRNTTANIMKKLNVINRAQAISEAFRRGELK